MNGLACLFSRPLNTLQTYAGDTSLPGGMSEEEDKTIEDTSVSSTIQFLTFFCLNDISYSAVKHSRRYIGYFLDLIAE